MTASDFCSEEKAKEVEDFFAQRKAPAADRAIKQAVEKIRSNARWLTTDGPAMQRWFAERYSPSLSLSLLHLFFGWIVFGGRESTHWDQKKPWGHSFAVGSSCELTLSKLFCLSSSIKFININLRSIIAFIYSVEVLLSGFDFSDSMSFSFLFSSICFFTVSPKVCQACCASEAEDVASTALSAIKLRKKFML